MPVYTYFRVKLKHSCCRYFLSFRHKDYFKIVAGTHGSHTKTHSAAICQRNYYTTGHNSMFIAKNQQQEQPNTLNLVTVSHIDANKRRLN